MNTRLFSYGFITSFLDFSKIIGNDQDTIPNRYFSTILARFHQMAHDGAKNVFDRPVLLLCIFDVINNLSICF